MKKTILSLFVSLLLVSCAGAGEADKKVTEKKNISLQLYSLRDDIKNDFDGVIKKVAEIGYTTVETANYADGKFYGKTPAEFKVALDTVGLTALSSHTHRRLSAEELKSKDFSGSLAWWDQAIAAHKEAGLKYMVMPSMQVPATLEELQVYCDYYNEIGRRAKEHGVKFGYHNHAFEFENKIEDVVMYDYMLKNTDPELVFFEMDVYWVVRGQQSPVDYFHNYPGRFKLLHVKDNKELGQSGMVGFDAIFKTENTDVAGVEYLVVEVEKYNLAPVESVKVSYDYLQQLDGVKVSYVK